VTTLITGGSGFVGLNIAERLLTNGHGVVIFDRNPRPEALTQSLEGLPGKLQWVTGNVMDKPELIDALKQYGVKRMVHGAAITAGIDREASQPAEIASVNLIGSINALDAAIQCQLQRVVQLGTGSVYGPSVKREGVLDEELDIPRPESLYGITKYAAELTALRFRSTRNLNVSVARLGVVFGRYEYDTGVRDTLSAPLALAALADRREHAKVYAGIPDDWVYATDVAIAVELLLYTHKPTSPVYHVSTGGAWSVTQWCERLTKAYPGFSYELIENQAQATVGRLTPSKRPPFSIDRISQEVGYRPTYEMDNAFTDYLMWRRSLTN